MGSLGELRNRAGLFVRSLGDRIQGDSSKQKDVLGLPADTRSALVGGNMVPVQDVLPGYVEVTPTIIFDETETGGAIKGTKSEDFWTNPVYGRVRNIDFNSLKVLEKSEWVQICTNTIIDAIVNAEWDIVPRVEGTLVDPVEVEMMKLFLSNLPRPEESFQDVLAAMLPDYLWYDAGVIVKVFPTICYDPSGNLIIPDGIYPVLDLSARDGRTFMIESLPVGGMWRKFWQYSWINPGGLPTPFDIEEVMYFRSRPSSRETYGTSRLEIIQNVIVYLMDSTESMSKYYENGLFIGGQIDHPDIKNPKILEKKAKEYKAQLQGPKKMNKWLVTGGGVEITTFPYTPTEMQWLDGQKWFAQLVMGIFNVTPSEIGYTDDLNRATGIQQMNIHKSRAIKPILNLIERVLNRQLVWKMNPNLTFKYKETLDLDDYAKQANIDATYLETGVSTINEIRERDGKQLYPDPVFDMPFAAQTVQAEQQMQMMEAQAELMPQPEDEEGGNESEEEKNDRKAKERGQKGDNKTEKIQRMLSEIEKMLGGESGSPEYFRRIEKIKSKLSKIPDGHIDTRSIENAGVSELDDFWSEVESSLLSFLDNIPDGNEVEKSNYKFGGVKFDFSQKEYDAYIKEREGKRNEVYGHYDWVKDNKGKLVDTYFPGWSEDKIMGYASEHRLGLSDSQKDRVANGDKEIYYHRANVWDHISNEITTRHELGAGIEQDPERKKKAIADWDVWNSKKEQEDSHKPYKVSKPEVLDKMKPHQLRKKAVDALTADDEVHSAFSHWTEGGIGWRGLDHLDHMMTQAFNLDPNSRRRSDKKFPDITPRQHSILHHIADLGQRTTRSEADENDHLTLYRGVAHGFSGDEYSSSSNISSWSRYPEDALRFCDEYSGGENGSVIQAKIPRSHVLADFSSFLRGKVSIFENGELDEVLVRTGDKPFKASLYHSKFPKMEESEDEVEKGLDMDRIGKAMSRVKTIFPGLDVGDILEGEDEEDGGATQLGLFKDGRIYLHPRIHTSEFNDRYSESIKDGFHPRNHSGDVVDAIVSHEVGHKIFSELETNKGFKEFAENFSPTREEDGGLAYQSHKHTSYGKKKGEIGTWAHKEAVPESVIQMVLNPEEKWSKYTRNLHETIRKELPHLFEKVVEKRSSHPNDMRELESVLESDAVKRFSGKFDKVDEPEAVERDMEKWQRGDFCSLEYHATRVFDLPKENNHHGTYDLFFNPQIMAGYKLSNGHPGHGENVDDSIKQYYSLNQKYMRDKYPEGKVTLYRGQSITTYSRMKKMGVKAGDTIHLKTYNLSSWSLVPTGAEEFAHMAKSPTDKDHKVGVGGVLFKAEVPIHRILSHPDVRYSHLSEEHNYLKKYAHEKEVIVVGSPIRATVHKIGSDEDGYSEDISKRASHPNDMRQLEEVWTHPEVEKWSDKVEGNFNYPKDEQIRKDFEAIDAPNYLGAALERWQKGSSYFNLEYHATKAFNLNLEDAREDTQTIWKNGPGIGHHAEFSDLVTGSLKQYYALTQNHLGGMYPGNKMTLYRGLGGGTYKKVKDAGLKPGDDFDLKAYNLSSWSTEERIGENFGNIHHYGGGVVVKAEVPIHRILMAPTVRYGHTDEDSDSNHFKYEHEAIVIGPHIHSTLHILGHPEEGTYHAEKGKLVGGHWSGIKYGSEEDKLTQDTKNAGKSVPVKWPEPEKKENPYKDFEID